MSNNPIKKRISKQQKQNIKISEFDKESPLVVEENKARRQIVSTRAPPQMKQNLQQANPVWYYKIMQVQAGECLSGKANRFCQEIRIINVERRTQSCYMVDIAQDSTGSQSMQQVITATSHSMVNEREEQMAVNPFGFIEKLSVSNIIHAPFNFVSTSQLCQGRTKAFDSNMKKNNSIIEKNEILPSSQENFHESVSPRINNIIKNNEKDFQQ